MRRVKAILIFGLSLVAALAGLDAYLQWAEIQTPMETRIDPRLGPTYIPHKRISRFNEGFYLGAANAYGYMGPAAAPRREGRERRILLLGDSFVLGHTVLDRHHFARTLERELAAATGQPVRALNFGKADFNFWNMYQYFLSFAGSFDHDLALFFVGESDLIPTGQTAGGLYPLVRLQGDSVVVDTSFRNGGSYRFYKAIEPVFTRSAVLRLIFNTYKMIRRHELAGVLFDKLAPARPAPSPLAPATVRRREMPELSRVILREMARDPRNVLVVAKDLAPGLPEEVAAAGLPTLNLAACLDSLQTAGVDPYFWPVTRMRGHWNHATHPVIGRHLARELLAKGLVWPETASTPAGATPPLSADPR